MKTTDREVKTDLPAEMKTQRLELIIEGVRVIVRLDERGRPVSAIAACWEGRDAQRITRLALNDATWRLNYEAEQKLKQTRDANRTTKSTKKKRENARDHWALAWLKDVHKLRPDYGAKRLAQAARKMIALNCKKDSPEFAKREEITQYRAKQYLKTARGK